MHNVFLFLQQVVRMIPVVCATLYCVPCIADETGGWVVTLGLNAYGKNNVHYNGPEIIGGHTSVRDDNCGYNLSVGYDWDWVVAELAMNRVRADGANAVAITGRITMPVLPLENLPYIGVEYGAVGARYRNAEYNISLHDETSIFGLLMGMRYRITNSLFINLLWQYNIFKMHADVYDVPIKFRVHRQNVSLGAGWLF